MNLSAGLSSEKSESAAQLWRGHFVALSRSMVDQSVLVNRVVDMDWRFGVTAASSELAQAGSTFLQLKLVVRAPVLLRVRASLRQPALQTTRVQCMLSSSSSRRRCRRASPSCKLGCT